MEEHNLSKEKKIRVGKLDAISIILLLSFLATMNFVGRYYYFFVITFIVVLFHNCRGLKINAEVVIEFFLGLALLFFSNESLGVTNIIKPFVYFMGGVIGCNILRNGESLDEKEKNVYKIMGALALGAWIHLLLNMLLNSKSIVYRNTVDVWTHKVYGATGQAGLGILAIAYSVANLFSRKGEKSKAINLFILLVVLAYNLILAGRTLLAVFFVEVAVAFVSVLYVNKDGRLKWKTVVIVIAMLCCIAAIYSFNMFNVREIVEKTTFYQRFFSGNYSQKIGDDDRLTYKMFYLNNMGRFLFGGTHLRSELGHYAHDLLLDGYDIGGIFTLTTLFFLLIFSARNLIQTVFNRNLKFETKLLTICFFCAFYIEFCMEPILAGFQWLFTAFCIINAVLNSLNKNLLGLQEGVCY